MQGRDAGNQGGNACNEGKNAGNEVNRGGDTGNLGWKLFIFHEFSNLPNFITSYYNLNNKWGKREKKFLHKSALLGMSKVLPVRSNHPNGHLPAES